VGGEQPPAGPKVLPAAAAAAPPGYEHHPMIDRPPLSSSSPNPAVCHPQAARATVEPRPRGRRLRAILGHEQSWWEAVLAHGPDHPALISTRDIAEATRRQPQTVRLWRMLGRMPLPVIVRGRLRHLRREVQTWALAQGRPPIRSSRPR